MCLPTLCCVKKREVVKAFLIFVIVQKYQCYTYRYYQEGSNISRQNLNKNLETLHLAYTLFHHLPGFYLKTGFLKPHPLSSDIAVQCSIVIY